MMSGNVSLRQLQAFAAVAREGSFTRAAARLRVTQSALTMSVKALEAEVGLRLLDRTTRSVAPTAQGERFAAVAERLIEEMERALDDLSAHAERRRGLVAAAATASFIGHAFAPALGALARRHPGISVRLVEEHTAGAARRLLAGEVDFAVTTLPSPDPALEAVPLLRDRFGLVCPADHPLARTGRTLGWSALRDHPVVGLSAESGIRAILERHAAGGPALRRPRHEVSSVAGLQSLVEQGLGVTAMPTLAALPMTRAALVFRPLAPAVHRVVYLAVRPGRSPTPAASAVVAALLERLEGLSGRDIEVLAHAAGLAEIGFGAAEPARRRRVTGQP
jgi:LysR family carnitine catabolism transcriptional activator